MKIYFGTSFCPCFCFVMGKGLKNIFFDVSRM